MVNHILFVCTGNTCRSPLAEAILQDQAKKHNLPLEVKSAGVSATNGSPISTNSTIILRQKGIHVDKKSASLSEPMVKWADVILTMTMGHKQAVIQRFPDALDKVFTLKEYTEDDPETLQLIAEREKLWSELQMKQILSQSITDEERKRAMELERLVPDYDITDPFGGSLEIYQQCAEEIERSLHKLVHKIDAGS